MPSPFPYRKKELEEDCGGDWGGDTLDSSWSEKLERGSEREEAKAAGHQVHRLKEATQAQIQCGVVGVLTDICTRRTDLLLFMRNYTFSF